jgi:IPT/TIG domain
MEDFRTALTALIDSYKNLYPRDLVAFDLFYATDLVRKDPDWLYTTPVPAITGLTPNTAVAGDATDITMVVAGSNFGPSSTIYFNGLPEPTTFVSDTEVSTGVKPSLFVEPATCPVDVRNPDGGKSEPLDFTFTETVTRSSHKK